MNRPVSTGQRLRRIVLWVNTLGLLVFLAWLAWGGQRIFHTQNGIVYLLPCLPFFFVYVFLSRRAGEGENDDDDSGR